MVVVLSGGGLSIGAPASALLRRQCCGPAADFGQVTVVFLWLWCCPPELQPHLVQLRHCRRHQGRVLFSNSSLAATLISEIYRLSVSYCVDLVHVRNKDCSANCDSFSLFLCIISNRCHFV
mgnify:CR=1 FL=1